MALLLAQYRRVDLVEDAMGDAVEAAARRWPQDGEPDNPSAWLLTVARRRLLDRLRAEETVRRSTPDLARAAGRRQEGPGRWPTPVTSSRTRCCAWCSRPSGPGARGGRCADPPARDGCAHGRPGAPLPGAGVHRGRPDHPGQEEDRGAAIPFGVPDAGVLPERLDAVARVAYLAFTAGYAPGTGPDLLRAETSGEAIRLVRVVLGVRPDEPVLVALLALLLLQHSRRDARVAQGRLVLLPDQDRGRWHHDEIAEALSLLDHPALAGPVTVQAAAYVLQARIAAEHARTLDPHATRWERVVALYDTLLAVSPSPGARLARAVAVAEMHGPAAGIAALEGIEIPAGHRVAAVRAELLARHGDTVGARAAYDQAIAACRNDVEIAHLRERRAALA